MRRGLYEAQKQVPGKQKSLGHHRIKSVDSPIKERESYPWTNSVYLASGWRYFALIEAMCCIDHWLTRGLAASQKA